MRAKYAFPKFKVYIFGVDITADVVEVSSGRDGVLSAPATCSLTLVNDNDKYVINTSDVAALNKVTNLKFPWLEGEDGTSGFDQNFVNEAVAKATKALSEDFAIKNPMKQRILKRKFNITQQFEPDLRKANISGGALSSYDTKFYGSAIKKYPISDGSVVFHATDPVRVFMRDPYEPQRWYHYFSGFVSDTMEKQDQNGASIVTIQAEDPTKLFRNSRVAINPGLVDARKVIFEEDQTVVAFQNFLKGLDLPEAIFSMLFGPDKVGNEKYAQKTYSINGESILQTRLRGVGHFAYDQSGIYSYGPTQGSGAAAPVTDLALNTKFNGKVNLLVDEPDQYVVPSKSKTNLYADKPVTKLDSLEQWQHLIDHEVCLSDMWSMATELDRENAVSPAALVAARLPPDVHQDIDGYVSIEQVVDYIGQHPDQYPVDGGRVMLLMPTSLGEHNRALIMLDIISSYPMETEFVSVGAILNEIIARIDFNLFASPKGDIILEFPFYDFDPLQFGMKARPASDVMRGIDEGGSATVPNTKLDQVFKSRNRGPFGRNYVIHDIDIASFDCALIDSKIYTTSACQYYIIRQWESIGTMAGIQPPVVKKLPDLIPLYGVRHLNCTPRGYMASPEAAESYMSLQLNRANADAHTLKVDINPNLAMLPNRPVYIARRNMMATVKKVSHTLAWGASGSMATSVDLYAARIWSGEVNAEGVPQFWHLGTPGGKPIDYSLWFRERKPAANPEVVPTNGFDSDLLAQNTDNMVRNTLNSPSAQKAIKSAKRSNNIKNNRSKK